MTQTSEKLMTGLTVKTMLGMGDNLWSRPIIWALARKYDHLTLITPWPQCYVDIVAAHPHIRFARASTRLRTQGENIARMRQVDEIAPGVQLHWVDHPGATPDDRAPAGTDSAPAFRLAYRPEEIKAGSNHHDSLVRSARQYLGGEQVDPREIAMRIPDAWQQRADTLIQHWATTHGKPVVLVRPPTVRAEWKNPARNCDPAALQHLVDMLRDDYTLVGLAHLKEGVEWLAYPEPQGLHVEMYRGEISVEVMLGLVARVWSIGANGFLVPMALAAQGYTFILFGGNYGYNAPENLLHPGYDLSRLDIAEPDNPHRGCTSPSHACDKRIDPDRLRSEFDAWRDRQQTNEVEMGKQLTAASFDREYYEEHKAAGLDYLGHGAWQQRYAGWLSDVFGWRDEPILDIGCACGSIAKGFEHAGAKPAGIDVNEHMVGLGRKRWPDLALATCDAVNMHLFPDGMFAGLHSAQVAEHWKPELVPFILRECRRVLEDGGLFFCCMDTTELYERQGRSLETEDPTHTCVKPMDWWRERFAAAGFEDVTDEYRAKLLAHPQSMLAGSTSDSPAKYDWDFVVMRAAGPAVPLVISELIDEAES